MALADVFITDYVLDEAATVCGEIKAMLPTKATNRSKGAFACATGCYGAMDVKELLHVRYAVTPDVCQLSRHMRLQHAVQCLSQQG